MASRKPRTNPRLKKHSVPPEGVPSLCICDEPIKPGYGVTVSVMHEDGHLASATVGCIACAIYWVMKQADYRKDALSHVMRAFQEVSEDREDD